MEEAIKVLRNRRDELQALHDKAVDELTSEELMDTYVSNAILHSQKEISDWNKAISYLEDYHNNLINSQK